MSDRHNQGERLQKVLAACGLGARRACERLITEGRVEVDGRRVVELGTRVGPEADIQVDGRPVRTQRKIYLALNKPHGVLCAMRDDRGRRTLTDLLPAGSPRLFHVGRLDYDSEGLLLLTNDGELAQRLAHPRHEVEKTYLAWIDGPCPPDTRRLFLRGVESRGEILRAHAVSRPKPAGTGEVYEVVLREGRNRQVRRMFEALGRRVLRLRRVAIGPVTLGRLATGATRALTDDERVRLKRETGA